MSRPINNRALPGLEHEASLITQDRLRAIAEELSIVHAHIGDIATGPWSISNRKLDLLGKAIARLKAARKEVW